MQQTMVKKHVSALEYLGNANGLKRPVSLLGSFAKPNIIQRVAFLGQQTLVELHAK